MKIIARIEKAKDFWFLLVVSFFFFILRLPSLFEPYWYGDEGIYQVLGMAIRKGGLLYRDVWDNKPPLLYFIYAAFNGDQFYVRLFFLITGLFSVFAFFYLAKKIFNPPVANLKTIYSITALYAFLFATPLLEGNIANAENIMLLPVIIAAILVLKKNYFFSGLLLGIAFATKIVVIFDLGAFLTFLLITSFEESFDLKFIKNLFKKIIPLVGGFFIPLLLVIIYFLTAGSLNDFLNAAFFQMFGYVGYGNKLIIPQGFLILKLLILTGFCLLVFKKRSSLDKSLIFILIWFAFSVFNALFSQRPYTHYVLVLLPSFCLLIGIIWNKKYQKILIVALIIFLIFIQSNFYFYTKILNYYSNFISFITSSKNINDYYSFFDRQTPIDYLIADFIKTNAKENDNIFIWGNNAQVYKMTGKLPPIRYTVAYHITTNKKSILETAKILEKNPPKYIIIMQNIGERMPFVLPGYNLNRYIGNSAIYEKSN